MRTHQLFARAFALAAVAACAAAAFAGDAVRLLVEPPKDVIAVEAGDPAFDVQITGLDVTGARVAPAAGKTIEVSATNGDLVLVEAPGKYRYTPPAAADVASVVKLRAWIKQNPEIAGDAVLTLVPRRPFERLVLVAPATTVALGGSIQIEVRGIKIDGTTAPATSPSVKMTVDGVGAVESVSPGVFKFNAPAKTETKTIGSAPHLRAVLDGYPKVVGDLALLVTAELPVAPPTPVPPVNPGTLPGLPPGTVPGTAPGAAPPAGTKPADEVAGVVWPGGDVKLVEWRWKTGDPKEIWSQQKKRPLPQSGKALIAPLEFQFLRVQMLRNDVKKIEVEWYVDKKNGVVRTDDADKGGRLRVDKNATRTDAVILMATPEDGKTLMVDLLLTLSDGKILTEQFQLIRGKDKDGDGAKDKK